MTAQWQISFHCLTTLLRPTPFFIARMYAVIRHIYNYLTTLNKTVLMSQALKKKSDSFTIISVFLKYRLSNSFEYYN